MKYCSECGHESNKDEKFCSQCGHAIKQTEETSNPKTNADTHMEDKSMGMKGRQEYFPAEAIKSIHVSCKLSRVHVIGSNGNNICFRWNNTKVRTLNMNKNGDALQLSDKAVVAIYGPLGLYELKKENQLTIEIPNSYKGSITIESASEVIDMANIRFTGTIYARVTTNALKFSSVKATTIDLQAGSGLITCKNIDADNCINISSTSGSIDCGIADSADNYLIDCYSQYGACSIPPTHGGGPKKLHVHSANGSVRVSFNKN